MVKIDVKWVEEIEIENVTDTYNYRIGNYEYPFDLYNSLIAKVKLKDGITVIGNHIEIENVKQKDGKIVDGTIKLYCDKKW